MTMSFYLSLPLLFLKFWFIDMPVSLWNYSGYVNKAFFRMFSLPLMIQTFFRPWKNEYRKEFVPVAIGIGIGIKSAAILADMILFIFLCVAELTGIIGLVLLPFIALYILFL